MFRSLRRCLATIVVPLALTIANAASGQEIAYDLIEGFTEPYKMINVASPESGILVQLDVEEGDRVTADQVIGALNSDLHQAMLNMAQAAMEAHGRLDSAKAEVDLREDRLEKLRRLAERGHARKEEISRAQTDLEIARGNLLAVQEDLLAKKLDYERIRVQLDRRSIRVPWEGVVTQVFKHPGEFVGPSDPVIAEIVQLHPLAAVFMVTREQAQQLSEGDEVQVQMSASAIKAAGTIEFISPTTEAESGLVRLKVRVDNQDQKLHSGEACTLIQ